MPRRADTPRRHLTTVLFTDIVGSTSLAADLGDRRWGRLLARHHVIVRAALKRHGGREIDTAGDGFLATFEQPGRAIECAVELARSLRELGIEIRGGINTGEVEVTGPNVRGIAVHVGSRVMSMAAPGEIWVSGTVRDLMSGSDFRFQDRGTHALKGVPGEWRLYSVEAPPSAEPLLETEVEPSPIRRPWFANRPVVVAGLAVLAGLVVGAILLSRRGDGPDSAVPAANTVVQLDPETGEIVGVTRVGTDPVAVTFGLDSIWVANFTDRTVQRVDPSSGVADSPIGIGRGNPTAITTGAGFVWVSSSIDGVVYRIDPGTGVPLEIPLSTGIEGIAYGGGAIWVTNEGTSEVLRIDPESQSIDAVRLDADSGPTGIAVGAGSVWVAESLQGRVTRIDLASLEVVGTVPVRVGQPEQVVFGAGSVWVSVGSGDSILRIEPTTGGATTIAVGNEPAGIGVDAGGVWIANRLDGTVVQVDPRLARVSRRVRLGFTPQGVAVSPEGIWVTLSR